MSAISSSGLSISRTTLEVTSSAVRSAASATSDNLLQSIPATAEKAAGDPQRESVRVSSSIGRAATAGQLSRQEALEIYRQIASLL